MVFQSGQWKKVIWKILDLCANFPRNQQPSERFNNSNSGGFSCLLTTVVVDPVFILPQNQANQVMKGDLYSPHNY